MAFINEWFWFFLLLPIAAISGWVIGRRGGERHSDTQVSRLSTTLGVALLVALLLGVLLGGMAIAASVVLPLRRRLSLSERQRIPPTTAGT